MISRDDGEYLFGGLTMARNDVTAAERLFSYIGEVMRDRGANDKFFADLDSARMVVSAIRQMVDRATDQRIHKPNCAYSPSHDGSSHCDDARRYLTASISKGGE